MTWASWIIPHSIPSRDLLKGQSRRLDSLPTQVMCVTTELLSPSPYSSPPPIAPTKCRVKNQTKQIKIGIKQVLIAFRNLSLYLHTEFIHYASDIRLCK